MKRTKAKVIMLPTENTTDIIVPTQGVGKNIIHFREYYGSAQLEMGDQYQYLYIVSYEIPKVGDWALSNKKVMKLQPQWGWAKGKSLYEKIIATNDPKLKVIDFERNTGSKYSDIIYKPLPEPQKSFIKEYCQAGGIDEVEIEMTNPSVRSYKGENGIHKIPSEIKVNPDNTINIHSTKKSWTREEVEAFGKKCFDYGVETESGQVDCKTYGMEEEWIKQNL